MSDRITIINNDNGTVDVNINGENVEQIPTTNLDSNIHAVQWYGDYGEVEYDDRNEKVDDFSEFDAVVIDTNNEVDRRHEEDINKALANEPSEEEKDREERDNLLLDTDWISNKYSDLGRSMPKEWLEYRQSLRDITEQNGFPGNVDWPKEPTTTP